MFFSFYKKIFLKGKFFLDIGGYKHGMESDWDKVLKKALNGLTF